MPKKPISLLFLFVLLSVLTIPTFQQTKAQAGTTTELIQAVNQLRAQYGLFPLEPHPILMSVAQSHSDYQASIKTSTHIGAGGTSENDRTRAAGFCAGRKFWTSENVAGGTNVSIQETLNGSWSDTVHMNTMLSGWGVDYIYIGAGVGRNGDYVAYTVIAGVCSGDPVPTAPPSNTTPVSTVTDAPVTESTSVPEGTILHVVEAGQTLWTISALYEVPLDQILALNGFTENTIIYPGDTIIIKLGETSTPTRTPERTATPPLPSPSPTAIIQVTASATDLPEASQTPTISPTSPSGGVENTPGNQTLVIISLVLSSIAILLSLAQFFTRK